jgi:phosphate transport system substrate-binding protein
MEKGGAAPQDNPALQSTLTYEGAITLSAQLLPELARVFLAKEGVAFGDIGEGGSGAGYKAVTAGKVSFGGMVRELHDNEKAALAAWQTIGYDAVGIYVHPGNPINMLTKAQLKDIFAGRITNWREVGGADKPITCHTEKLDSGRGTLSFFKEKVLHTDTYGPVREHVDMIDCIWAVEEDLGGITFSTFALATPKVKAIALDEIPPTRANVASGKYPLTRPLLLITMMPSGNVRKFWEFTLTPEAQAIVGKRFVPLQ